MSRITCLIIFSGSSALSIRSLRLARTNVETRSSKAMLDSFFCFLLLASCSYLLLLALLIVVILSGAEWMVREKRTIRGVEGSLLPRDSALGSARHFHKNYSDDFAS